MFLLAHCLGPLFIQSKPLSHASLKRFTFEAKELRFSRNKTFIASFLRILTVAIVLLLRCLLLLIIWPNQKSNNTHTYSTSFLNCRECSIVSALFLTLIIQNKWDSNKSNINFFFRRLLSLHTHIFFVIFFFSWFGLSVFVFFHDFAKQINLLAVVFFFSVFYFFRHFPFCFLLNIRNSKCNPMEYNECSHEINFKISWILFLYRKILFDNNREHEQPPRTKDYIYKFSAEKVKEKVFLVLTNMISYI